MGTILAEVKGFTPLIDALVKEVGVVQAAVYGAVWRHCQMSDGVCTASQATIAKKLGINRVTVLRHLKDLCKKGYLRDTTPTLRNRPHIYADTGKAKILALVEARTGVTESNSDGIEDEPGVAESDSTVAESNTQVSQKVTRREHDTSEESISGDTSDSGEKEPTGEALLEEHFGPRPDRGGDPLQTKPWADRLADSPWLAWHPERAHPQAGVSAEALQRVGWLVENVTGLCPVDGELKGWLKGCVTLYQVAKEDWPTLERGIRKVWSREEQYRPGHIRGFVDEVRKAASAKGETIGW